MQPNFQNLMEANKKEKHFVIRQIIPKHEKVKELKQDNFDTLILSKINNKQLKSETINLQLITDF